MARHRKDLSDFKFNLQLHVGAATQMKRARLRRQAAQRAQAGQVQADAQAKQDAENAAIGQAAAEQTRQTLGNNAYSGGAGTIDNAIMQRDAARRRIRGAVAGKQLLGE